MAINDRLQHAWNAFMNKDPTYNYREASGGSYYRPDRFRPTRGHEKTIITSVHNRIAVDAAAISIQHIRMDANNRFVETVDSGLNNCLSLEANVDQTGRALIQDIVMSMIDEGCVAIVPTDITTDPKVSASMDINELRVGKIVSWYPSSVKVRLYNELTGNNEELTLPKRMVAIVENPLYAVMNEPNSTMQRLIRKLALLDVVDEQSGSGKLNMIIQLPYIIKTEARKQQAAVRMKAIEEQLKGPYGIAYTDGTEKVTQLNRPIENNLMSQIEYLTSMLYSQLGLTSSIMDGTANDTTMNNYYNRTIEPILSAIVDEMKRKFLTKTARTQRQSIAFFRDPLKLIPVSLLPDIADKLTRNEIVTSNEIRQVIGLKPSADPNADQLRNKNLNSVKGTEAGATESPTEEPPSISENQVEAPSGMSEEEYLQSVKELDDLDVELDSLEDELNADGLKHYASKYYDAQKAHEYYERTKQLKNRKSTAGLNESGKQAARYVKESLSTERKGKVESEKVATKAQVESHKNQMKGKIDALRARLKSMSSSARASSKASIQAEIDSLREDNKAFREKVQASFKETRTNLKSEYDEKYISELDKIKSTGSFQKGKKRK